MDPLDIEKTALGTPMGNFHDTIIQFALKNASAIDQRIMTVIFHDILHDYLKNYADDIVMI